MKHETTSSIGHLLYITRYKLIIAGNLMMFFITGFSLKVLWIYKLNE